MKKGDEARNSRHTSTRHTNVRTPIATARHTQSLTLYPKRENTILFIVYSKSRRNWQSELFIMIYCFLSSFFRLHYLKYIAILFRYHVSLPSIIMQISPKIKNLPNVGDFLFQESYFKYSLIYFTLIGFPSFIAATSALICSTTASIVAGSKSPSKS